MNTRAPTDRLSPRPAPRVAAVLGALVSLALLLAPSASAAVGHHYLSQITEVPASSGASHPGPLSAPGSLTIGPADSLWLADPGRDVADEFSASGAFLLQQAGTAGGPGSFTPVTSTAQGISSLGVNPTTGDLYVAEPLNRVVDVFGPDGAFKEAWNGTAAPGGFGTEGTFNLAVDPVNGDVYVDSQGTVDRFNSVGVYQSPRVVVGGVFSPARMAAFAGHLYVLSGALTEYDSATGSIVTSFGDAEPTDGRLSGVETPLGFIGTEPAVGVSYATEPHSQAAVDPTTGDLYLVASRNKVVEQFSPSGHYLGQVDGGETPAGRFLDPSGVAIDSAGHLYVADFNPELPAEAATGLVDVFGSDLTQRTLTVSTAGPRGRHPGSGENSSVLSAPPGIEETWECYEPGSGPDRLPTYARGCASFEETQLHGCEEECSAQFDPGAEVTLSATPVHGFRFKAWAGCDAEPGPTECKIEMSADRAVTAEFEEIPRFKLNLTRTGAGHGEVSCEEEADGRPEPCAAEYLEGTDLTIAAIADERSTFAGFSGDCAGTGPCEITTDAEHAVTADFSAIPQQPLTVAKVGSGQGTVTGTSPGPEFTAIACGSTCSAEYDQGATVTLTAVAVPTSTFLGFSGACTGTGPCQLTLSAARSVQAEFAAIPQQSLTVTKTGSGFGTVTDSGGAIDCGGACSHPYNQGTLVTLSASPEPGSAFVAWQGCEAESEGSCQVTMGAARSVSAEFAPAPVTCPNEALRTESHSLALPECRAYEQATPPYKEGARVNLLAASADGSHLIVTSLGNFGDAGNSQDNDGIYYQLSRAPSGWRSADLTPPASQFPYGRNLAASPGLDRTLWALRSTDQSIYAVDLWLRDADGAMHDLGPLEPPSATVGPPGTGYSIDPDTGQLSEGGLPDHLHLDGASADLSHVLFSISPPAKRSWPGEASTGPSTYEYVLGQAGPPIRIGLDNQGHLISSCGTSGSISTDGETVIFTAQACGASPPTDQLFARLHADRPQSPLDGAGNCTVPADACTVPLAPPAPAPYSTEPGFQRLVLTAGSRAYFTATAVLTAAPNGLGAQAQAGQPNLYVYDLDTGHTAFVATAEPGEAQATPDGRFLLFSATGDLTPDDTAAGAQLFRYDAASGQLLRVSIGQRGFADNGNDALAAGSRGVLHSISDDGSTIVFQSSYGLTPNALDHVIAGEETACCPSVVRAFYANNVYLWHQGSLSLLSDGQDKSFIGGGRAESAVSLLGIDGSGEDVFLQTADPLAPTDTDTEQDLYDVRIGGGFAAPQQVPCCKPPPSAPSLVPAPSHLLGPGNPEPPSCKKGHVRRHGHCVRRSHRPRHHKSRKPRRGGAK